MRPKLYLAIGISGMVQHIAGMQGACMVVAVNTDKRAPIFAHADYGITADWEVTVDTWITQLEERKDEL